MAKELTDDQVNQIREELNAGRKLHAVKLFKNWTGSSLLESKNAFERLEDGQGLGSQGGDLPKSQMDQILDAIDQGQKLQAVKLYKSVSGRSLKESKEFIEDLMNELEIEDADSVPHGSGCAAVILMLAVASAVLVCCWMVPNGIVLRTR